MLRAKFPRVRKVLAVLAVVAVLVTTFATFVSIDTDETASPTTTTTTAPVSTEDLGPAAQELVALLEAAKDETYHAEFEGTSPESPDSVIRLETWQRPPFVRQDSSLTVAGQLARTASFALPDGGVRCTRIGEQPWSCRSAGPGELSADALSGSVLERLATSDVRVRSTAVDGVDVKCFTLTSATEGSSELCVDEAGVAVRVRSGGSELRRVVFDAQVGDDSVFEPPA